MRQIALDIGLEAPQSLDNFEPTGNEAAFQAVQAWVQAVGVPHRAVAPVLYLWGEEGAGKSHLLRAAATALTRRSCRFGWMSSDALGKQGSATLEFAPDWDAIILDDVDVYDADSQYLAFNWFVNAFTPQIGRPRPVLASGQVPPADLRLRLRDDLRSRLAWGDVHPLKVLDESTARQALQRRAKAKGLVLSDDVLNYVLVRFSRDTGSLMQLLDHLDRYALQTQRAITVPMLKAMFHDV